MAEPLRLGDHCEKIGAGATPRGGKVTYSDNGPIALIRSQNVYNDRFVHDGIAFISEKQAAPLQNVEVQEGDVLLNLTGDSVARVCQVAPDILPARVTQSVAIIRPRRDRIDPRFLRYYLITPSMQTHMLGLASTGATRNALTKSMIEEFRVPAWPVNHQMAIASILGALDEKIELTRRMNETLVAMAQAIFKDWFVDFGPTRAKMEGREPYLTQDIWNLFPGKLDDEGKPEGWKFGSLADIADTNLDSWTAKNHPEIIEYVDLSSAKWGNIEATALLSWAKAPSRARRIAKKGDTIVGTTRPGNGSFSYISRDGLTVSTGFAVLSPKKPCFQDIVYIAATFPTNIERLANLADGHGGVYPAVKPNEVSDTALVIADEKAITKFADLISSMREKIESFKVESLLLAKTRDLLLPKLMSGEIQVAGAEKTVQEAVASETLTGKEIA